MGEWTQSRQVLARHGATSDPVPTRLLAAPTTDAEPPPNPRAGGSPCFTNSQLHRLPHTRQKSLASGLIFCCCFRVGVLVGFDRINLEKKYSYTIYLLNNSVYNVVFFIVW